MKKKNKILAGVLASACVIGGGFALTGCGEVNVSLEILNDFQYEYYYGEELNLEGGVLKYTVAGQEPEYIAMTDEEVEVEYFDSNRVGTYTLVITYKGETLEVEYKVNDIVEMVDGAFYVATPTASAPGYTIMQLDRTNHTLNMYTITEAQATTVDEAMEIVKTGADSETHKSQMRDFTVQLIEGKNIITYTITYEGGAQESVLNTLTPSADGTLVLMMTAGGQSFSVNFTIYND